MAPVIVLFVIAPLIAEYLLGNVPTTMIALLPPLSLLYGSGAVLIREVTRQTGRGWPSILMLATAYGVLEEAFATQSIFNPNFEGLRLLDYGYVPALGISGPWTVFTVTLHVVWSIATPIALTELLFRERRNHPWLGRRGLIFVGALFVFGLILIMAFMIWKSSFVATPLQFGISGAIVVALVIAAFRLFPPRTEAELQRPPGSLRRAPKPWLIGVVAFLTGYGFYLLHDSAADWGISPIVEVLLILAAAGGSIALISWSSGAGDWSDIHRFALLAGSLLVYCWWGFSIEAELYPGTPITGRIMLVCGTLTLLLGLAAKVGALGGRANAWVVAWTRR